MAQPIEPILSPKPSSSKATAGKYFIKTFGCQMNVADSERMSALLEEQGMNPSSEIEDAQVIIINGCTVREKAVHKALSALGRLQDLKKDYRTAPLIGIGGCVGQLDRAELFKQAPYIDFVFGTDTIDNLPEIIHRVKSGERHVVYADFDPSMNYSTETKVVGAKAQAYVNIMKGCDKYCTYCIVPFTRGREKSRMIDEVVEDVARLVSQGVREITLLGQNVNSFGKGNPNTAERFPQELHNIIGKVGPRAGEENFPQLLRALDSDPRLSLLKRIRFTSSHPLDFSDELIDCYAPVSQGGVGKLTGQLHLPVQSGSNRILQKMGRHHQIENYIAQMDHLRELRPDVGISSDLIVGFPGETEEDFQETMKLIERMQFDVVFAFAYSPRPGTRAFKLEDDVPDDVKNDRLNRLLDRQGVIGEKKNQKLVGTSMEILVEGLAKNQKMQGEGNRVWAGRTHCNRIVNFISHSPRSFVGKLVSAKIISANSYSLVGEVPEIMQEGDVI